MIQRFSKKEAIKFGWEKAKKNIKFFSLVFIFIFGLTLILEAAINLAEKKIHFIYPLLHFLKFIFYSILNFALIKIFLSFSRDEKLRMADIFPSFFLFLNYFLASLFLTFLQILSGTPFFLFSKFFWFFYFSYFFHFRYFLLLIFGLIFFEFIIFYLIIRFNFYGFLVVDKNLNAINSLKESWAITKGNVINLILFYFFCSLINILGFFSLVVGLLWSIPTTIMAKTFVYLKLSKFLESQKVN